MKSNYALYIKERENKEIIENEVGFITYLIFKESKTVYLSDFFTRKEFRGTGKSREQYNQLVDIALKNECDTILTSVDKSTNNYKNSEGILEKAGYVLISEEDDMKYFIKDVHNGW